MSRKNRTMEAKHAKARREAAKEGNWRASCKVAMDYQFNSMPKHTQNCDDRIRPDLVKLGLVAKKKCGIVITKHWYE